MKLNEFWRDVLDDIEYKILFATFAFLVATGAWFWLDYILK